MAIKPLPTDQSAYVGTDGKPATVFYTWLKSLADALNGLLALFPGGTSSAAWTSYTPTATAGSGAITSYTASGSSYQIGKVVFVRFTVTITNQGTGAGELIVTLPATAASPQFIGGIEIGLSDFNVTGLITSGAAHLKFYDAATVINTNMQVVCSGVYEAA